MHIKELTIAEFNAFAHNHPLGSHYETANYAMLMTEKNFEYDLLGLVDELGVLKAAALILIKRIGFSAFYGYSPKGFLIDYFDYDLLNTFCTELKKYYYKTLTFIKINPEIAIGEIDIKTKTTNYNQNLIIRDYLKEAGFIKLKDNLYFESIFPRFNAIVNLKEYDFNNLSKNTKNKIRKSENKGLVIEESPREGLDIFFNFLKKKTDINEFYYKNYYNVFAKDNACDLFLIRIDYQKYLLNSKKLYEEELAINNELADTLITNSNDIIINKKMNSDKALLSYKNDIEFATLGLRDNKTTYLAGALVIKYNNRVSIIMSGLDKHYLDFNANYFLHYKLIEKYKDNYKYLDLNGITGDFTDTNPYKGLNEFKYGFKPNLYEFIGEFDLVLNDSQYKSLIKKGLLTREFTNL